MSRIKLAYPKIDGSTNCPAKNCIAFEKYDGTNLHWVWEHELGWYAFGTRRDRFDLDERGIADFHAAHPGLEEADALFARHLATPLLDIFRQHDYYGSREIVVFTEFLGPHSFAGLHKKSDPKRLVLFDVQTRDGMMGPDQFVTDFGALDIARVLYRGKLTGAFIHNVRSGKYGPIEGVVCKGGTGADLWRVKIKTDAYMEKLKQAFASDWERYWE